MAFPDSGQKAYIPKVGHISESKNFNNNFKAFIYTKIIFKDIQPF